MDVQHLEPFPQDHLVLLRGERQGIGVVIEERIAAHPGFHLMEIDPLGVSPKPKG